MTTSIFDTDAHPTEQPKLKPVSLRTQHDASLVVKALEVRVEDLKGLAKKNEAAGYSRHAREQLADAGALEHIVLPEFKTQQELPLATPAQVRGGIANAVRMAVRDQLVVRLNNKASEEEIERSLAERENAVCNSVAEKMERYTLRLVELAYKAGIAARESTPEVIALRAVDAMWEER